MRVALLRRALDRELRSVSGWNRTARSNSSTLLGKAFRFKAPDPGTMGDAVRRPLALLCIAVLLMTALAVPAAGWAWATIEVALQPDPPALAAVVPCEPPAADARESARLAHLLFRGPPSPVVPDSMTGNPLAEETWHGRDGWPRPCST